MGTDWRRNEKKGRGQYIYGENGGGGGGGERGRADSIQWWQNDSMD